MKAKPLMIQGTMSNVGKSLLTAGLCRILWQDGYKVAPFKAQNMALNSWVTEEGLEMGRAQVVQAAACCIKPTVLMNPILLKPTTDMGSQVIVKGEVYGNMEAGEYFAQKKLHRAVAFEAYEKLAEEYEIILLEGAGSPAEINLRKDDFVNMGLAEQVRTPVLLVGDIDRGGVFAQLYGTLLLLSEDERDLVKGLIINKFRGNRDLLQEGLSMIEERSAKPVLGVVPMLDVDIEDEDSLSNRFTHKRQDATLDIAVIRLPKIANFTDFYALEATEGLSIRYIDDVQDLQKPDMLVIPGTKNTISDLKWLRESGMEAAILQLASKHTPVFGICGGYQMLGKEVIDGEGVELAGGGSIAGLGLLSMSTVFTREKKRSLVTGTVSIFGSNQVYVEGYEIHMGHSQFSCSEADKALFIQQGNVYGTYLHGFFDTHECRKALIAMLCKNKGIPIPKSNFFDLKQYREEQFNRLAVALRRHLDMDFIYKIVAEGV
ncbi:MAG: cobyric acid synthase [Treponema sp.]|jgi:adenosylcobyric acid synthase|nr:cobyric acid synthase [Treponema sp.]